MHPHPYASLFPMMDKKALQELVASIRDDGLQQPIVTFEGMILDGRNRDLACSNAQVKPVYEKYKGSDPLGFVMRANLTRRHLTKSQRALVAANLANLKNGEQINKPLLKGSTPQNCGDQNPAPISTKMAANALNVSTSSVETAKQVIASGDDDLIDAVASGAVAVSAAAKQLKVPVTSVVVADQPPKSKAECQRLLKLWDKTEAEGRALFLEAIGATT